MLSLDPVIGALAAGNAVVLKPSEIAPASASLLAKLLEEYLDNSAVKVVEGAVAETSALLEQKWDKIFYTGYYLLIYLCIYPKISDSILVSYCCRIAKLVISFLTFRIFFNFGLVYSHKLFTI